MSKETPENVLRSKLFPLVSRRKLEELLGMPFKDLESVASTVGRYYDPFDRRKPGTDDWRHIDNPLPQLKAIQKRILRRILESHPLPAGILGGVRGRSIRDNLVVHSGKPYLLKLDLRHCFPRTGKEKVFSVYAGTFGCSEEIASVLTRLTSFQRRVPQGAPTSSALVNLTLLPLFDELQALADTLALDLTFWVDDIAFSGDRCREAIEPAILAIMRHRHSVRRSKIKRHPQHELQTLTGGVVNVKPSAGRRRIAALRDEILEVSDSPRLVSQSKLDSLWGHINQISSICPSQGATLKAFATKLLPASGVQGDPRIGDVTRKCRRACRHERRRHSSGSQ